MIRDPAYLDECRALQRAIMAHPTLKALRAAVGAPELEARLARVLGSIRHHAPAAPPGPSPDPSRVHVVQWNIEHGNWYEQVEGALLRDPALRDADVLMFNEIDLGMARAGNRDVTADLARALRRFGVWAPLFLETTPGRDEDAACAAGCDNQEGLFGLAILSRWPIRAVRTVELPSPEAYQFDIERMYGRHVGLISEIDRPGAPFLAVSVHLEVHRTRARRAEQMRVLLESLRGDTLPIVLGGDFNSHTFDRGRAWDPVFGLLVLTLASDAALSRRFLRPDQGGTREPLFDRLAEHGFTWEPHNDREPTLQLRFERIDEARALPRPVQSLVLRMLHWAERRGTLRLDWLAGRGWRGGRGASVLGLHGPGKASDHAPIVAWFEG